MLLNLFIFCITSSIRKYKKYSTLFHFHNQCSMNFHSNSNSIKILSDLFGIQKDSRSKSVNTWGKTFDMEMAGRWVGLVSVNSWWSEVSFKYFHKSDWCLSDEKIYSEPSPSYSLVESIFGMLLLSIIDFDL